ncbi:MAG: hypothetical protein M1404_07180 [Acidobacteria bacterium]|nr:hypothetical protein [Acidobacteriota bacterium]
MSSTISVPERQAQGTARLFQSVLLAGLPDEASTGFSMRVMMPCLCRAAANAQGDGTVACATFDGELSLVVDVAVLVATVVTW